MTNQEAFYAGCQAGREPCCDPESDWLTYKENPEAFVRMLTEMQDERTTRRQLAIERRFARDSGDAIAISAAKRYQRKR